jgi:hypothetical protein
MVAKGINKTSRAKMSKLQRLACLGITDAIRTTPTAAVDVPLGLPPLWLKMKAEAQVGNYALMCSEEWKPRSIWYGHVKEVWGMMKEPILMANLTR